MDHAGLYSKYRVERISDVPPEESKHKECRYFVLDPQHDPLAREMLYQYAMKTDNEALSEDLLDWYEQT